MSRFVEWDTRLSGLPARCEKYSTRAGGAREPQLTAFGLCARKLGGSVRNVKHNQLRHTFKRHDISRIAAP